MLASGLNRSLRSTITLPRAQRLCLPDFLHLPGQVQQTRAFWSKKTTTSPQKPSLDMPVSITPRPSQERGNADHGWLKSFHTFSFASYHEKEHTQFGCLRVINEDRVEPQTGFGTHPHAEFEIFSYIVSGELQHRDSMGNVEILKRGDLQMTSAGTGIRHSEYQHGEIPVHFLQIWSRPHTAGLTPKYFTRHFADAEKTDRWVHVVAPAGSEGVEEVREHNGPAPVHSHLSMYATILSKGKSLSHTLPSKEGSRKAYVHLIQTSGYNDGVAAGASLKLAAEGTEVMLREGDGAYITGQPGKELKFENVGESKAEVVLFDIDD